MRGDLELLSSRPAGCFYLVAGLASLAQGGLLIGESHGIPDAEALAAFIMVAVVGLLLVMLAVDVLVEIEHWAIARLIAVLCALLAANTTAYLSW